MKQLKLPADFVEFYMNEILRVQRLTISTIFGDTPLFRAARGIPQGAVESPILFSLCYNIGLCRLKKETNGYKLHTHLPNSFIPFHNPLKNVISGSIHLTSYLDNIALVSNSRTELQHLVKISDSFNNLVNIATNPTKSVYFSKHTTETLPIRAGGDLIHPAPQDQVICSLGVYFSGNKNLNAYLDIATKELEKNCKILKSHRIGP